MSDQEIINTISEYSLTVRCLPYKVVNLWTYREGDENKKYVDSNGNPSKSTKTLYIREDGKKLLKEERTVERGGWWYVKETPNTNSTVRFNREYDKFFAPTLKEALQLFLNSKKSKFQMP